MRLSLDTEACEGYGICARHMPSSFSLDDWGYAILQGNGSVPHGQEHLARRAIDSCPVLAIREIHQERVSS